MKTKTFARLALSIPVLVWGACLLFLLIVFGLFPELQAASEISTLTALTAIVGMFLIFYVVGIIYWLVPYLSIALVLLFLSFKAGEKALKVVYSLSPLVMAVLILLIVTVSTSPTLDSPLQAPGILPYFQDLLDTGALFALLALMWGYLCVGIGFGIYKLLRSRGYLKDEIRMERVPAEQP